MNRLKRKKPADQKHKSITIKSSLKASKKNKHYPACPVCWSDASGSICDDLSIRKCGKCGSVFNISHREAVYENDYFISLYKDQYGGTYLEDYDRIYSNSRRRLNRIFRLLNKRQNLKEMNLIDIGSAMGFFLKAAKDGGIGFQEGVEISEYAAKYCKERYKINVHRSGFEDIKIREKYDIITAWYFVEHCLDPTAVILKIYEALNNNGIFAFSMPSFFGPSFYFNRNNWCATHPADHRIDLSPAIIRRLLKKYGFSKIKIYPAGIHPERIIHEKSVFFRPFKLIYYILSNILKFSDTMEVYAKK